MNVHHYVKFNNEYEFQCYCARQSMEAFQKAIDRKSYPSRYSLIFLLFADVSSTPFYLARKITEVVLHIWTIFTLQERERHLLHFKNVSHLAGLTIVQLAIPLTCTAIRICATLSGLLCPRWALYGWKVAESGEELSYRLWSIHLREYMSKVEQKEGKQIREEIIPTHAIFYLGKENTYFNLADKTDQQKQLEKEISSLFSDLLQDIATDNRDCFRKLLDYDCAIQPNQHLCKKHQSYLLSHDIKEILLQLKKDVPKELAINEDGLTQWLIDQVKKGLSIEQIRRLFCHVYLNLEAALLVDSLHLKPSVKQNFSFLDHLFCARFGCGCAQYPQTSSGLSSYLRI
jgi:hypothetical protein